MGAKCNFHRGNYLVKWQLRVQLILSIAELYLYFRPKSVFIVPTTATLEFFTKQLLNPSLTIILQSSE
ncbi:hypothetical protein L2E82_22217 [Cichorium intybus]|uniref:Uncharacterized protein n=1 Tax=Cichorium intybus TaxID=13427 RepID=A0ACB9DXG8_CICIN|nr:hypothetical protein L2E82_22217 [Cichorium intybus]